MAWEYRSGCERRGKRIGGRAAHKMASSDVIRRVVNGLLRHSSYSKVREARLITFCKQIGYASIAIALDATRIDY
ncbi:hypothetical protein CLD06_06035 [Wolbachia endosymbiont of Drosophila subpulchrella]|nr:hypothetical protein CLD06_06035 [Wolbachia endosymbiont of Drosophila subpulchrella]